MLTEGGSISDTLQEVTVPIMSNAQCRKTGYGEKRITDNMLCAGIPEGGKDSCQVKLIRRSICGYLYWFILLLSGWFWWTIACD